MLYYCQSDIHNEFRRNKEEAFWKEWPEPKEAKVCLWAGDLTVIGKLSYKLVLEHFTQLCRYFEQVIGVIGNHEFYGSSPEKVELIILEIEKYLPNLKILKTGEPFTYNNQRFLGGHLWYPDLPEAHVYKSLMSDTFQITGLFPWAFEQSNLFMTYLKTTVKEDDIIITHHIPTYYNIPSKFKNSQTNCFFTNRDSDLYIKDPSTIKPKAWLYGHTHTRANFTYNNTHFICNPIGYPKSIYGEEENSDWRTFNYEVDL